MREKNGFQKEHDHTDCGHFLASIAGVCAGDANDTLMAVDESNQMDVSSSDVITEDNLQTDEDNTILTQANDESDSQILGDGNGTYEELRDEIGSGGDKILAKSYYNYTGGETIEITVPGVIDGNGAVIDMAGSNIRAFTVNASDVTIRNLTIKNADFNYDGGAIYFAGSGTVTDCSFNANKATYPGTGGAVCFVGNGTVTNCNFTGNEAYYAGAIFFGDEGSVRNCNFIDNRGTGDYTFGGALYFVGPGNVTDCNFTANQAAGNSHNYGGAVYFNSNGTLTKCNFNGNQATGPNSQGGAVYFKDNATVTNCNFKDNQATSSNSQGGALYFSGNATVTDCNFVNNNAYVGSAIYSNENTVVTADTCIFKTESYPIYVNVDILSPTLNVDNFTAAYNSGEKLTFDLKTSSGIPIYDGNISISVYHKNNDSEAGNYSCLSGEGWTVDLPVGSYYAIFNTEYAEFQPVTRTIAVKQNPDLTIKPQEVTYANSTTLAIGYNSTASGTVNITLKGKNANSYDFTNIALNATVLLAQAINVDEYEVILTYSGDEVFGRLTANGTLTVSKANSTLTVSNITFDYGGKGSGEVSFTGAAGVNASVAGHPEASVDVAQNTITVSGLDAGTYTLIVTTIADANHNNVTGNATVTVNKLKTQLTADAVTATYNVNRELVITLRDSAGNALAGASITVDLNGVKTYATDKNGQVKVSTAGLTPKAYTAKIAYGGDSNHVQAAKDVKVTVKKATPKLTAAKKTYKAKAKTKKYTVTLKDNAGKAMKNVKVTLKLGKKTYRAKTNAKGKAVFKIKKLTKKGKYKATVKFAGNNCYNKVTKKVKITVK